MDIRHREIARIALSAASGFDFALAGGYAVSTHGMGNRLSGDVDIFTDPSRQADFPGAVDAVVVALQTHGYAVTCTVRTDTFARLMLTSTTGDDIDKLEMAVDWRAQPPVDAELGPVLHPDDAVANKMCALFGRAESRDFLDVDAAIRSGRYTRARLIELAQRADPGFDSSRFAEALSSLTQITDTDFAEYETTAEDLAALRAEFADWAVSLRKETA